MWSPGLVSVSLVATAYAAVPYSEYILAPSSRTLNPAKVYRVNGTVDNAESLLNGVSGSATFSANSSATFDFGKNIAGVVSVVAGQSSSSDAVIWLTYSESSIWINALASDATADAGLDEPLSLPVGEGTGTYVVSREHERGAFRYLSLINNGTGDIEITNVSVHYTAAPTQDLRNYTGYFHSNDELLNRIWYAGAYTNQLCTIDPRHGNALVHAGVINATTHIALPETVTWYNNYTITNGSTCIADGAKRDRLIWPGDMAVAVPSIAYSTYDIESVKNSVESLLVLQTAAGLLPYAGVPFNAMNYTSFTYHMHSLIGMYNIYYYTADKDWLEKYWDQYKLAMAWSLSSVDLSGLMNVTSSADWGRAGMGGHNVEANALLLYTLTQGIELAQILDDGTVESKWAEAAMGIKSAANKLLWDDAAGLYMDNETTTLHPQDGNCWAILANLTQTPSQSEGIMATLRGRWGKYGAPAPEAASSPETISPFIGSFELEAHCMVRDTGSALDLMRLQWGFMLDDERMTNSTFIEGYAADGSLVYAPYKNDARVSFAHGWASGPTSVLSRYVAGIRLTGAAGKTWVVEPMLGDLTKVEAGLTTVLGAFSVAVTAGDNGTLAAFSLETPTGTTGDVILQSGTKGTLTNGAGESAVLENGKATGLRGGAWSLKVST